LTTGLESLRIDSKFPSFHLDAMREMREECLGVVPLLAKMLTRLHGEALKKLVLNLDSHELDDSYRLRLDGLDMSGLVALEELSVSIDATTQDPLYAGAFVAPNLRRLTLVLGPHKIYIDSHIAAWVRAFTQVALEKLVPLEVFEIKAEPAVRGSQELGSWLQSLRPEFPGGVLNALRAELAGKGVKLTYSPPKVSRAEWEEAREKASEGWGGPLVRMAQQPR
jgi:hypothetical protein